MIEFFPLIIAFLLAFYLLVSDTSKLVTFIVSFTMGAIIAVYVTAYWFAVKMDGFLNF